MKKFLLEKKAFALISVAIILPFIFALCAIAYDLSLTLKNHSRLQDALREASFLSASKQESIEEKVRLLAGEYIGSDKTISNIQMKNIDGITKVTADITNNGFFNKFVAQNDITISQKGVYGMQASDKISDTDYIFAISFGKSGAENSTLFNSTLKNLCNDTNRNLIKNGACNPPLGKVEIIDATQTMIANIIKTAKEFDTQNKQYFGFIPYANAVMVKGKDLDETTLVDKIDGLTKSEYENAYYYIDPMDIYVPSEFKKVDYFSRFYPKSILNYASSKLEILVLNRLKALNIDTTIFTNEFAGDFLLRKFALDLNNERLQNYSSKDIEDAIKAFDLGYDNQKPGLNEGEFKKDATRIKNTIDNAFNESESIVFRLYNPKVDKLLIKGSNSDIIQTAKRMQIAEREYQSYLEALAIAKNALNNPIADDDTSESSDDSSQDDFDMEYYLKIATIYDFYNYNYDSESSLYGEAEFEDNSDEFYEYTDLVDNCKNSINNYNNNMKRDRVDRAQRNLKEAKDNCPLFVEKAKKLLNEHPNVSMPKLYETKEKYIEDLKILQSNIANKSYEDLNDAINKALNGDDSKIYEASYSAKDKNVSDNGLFIIAPTYKGEKIKEKPKITISTILTKKIEVLNKEIKKLQAEFSKLDEFRFRYCEDPKNAEKEPTYCDLSKEPLKSKFENRNKAKRELETKKQELDILKNTGKFLNGSDILIAELNNELIAKLEGFANEAYQRYKDSESELNSNFDFKGKALGNSYTAFLLGGTTQQTIANAMKFSEIKPLKIKSLDDIKTINILNEIPFNIDRGSYNVVTPLNKDFASVGLIRAALMATKTKSTNPNVKILVFSSAASDNDYALFNAGLCQRIKNGIKQKTGKNAEIYAITLGLSKDETKLVNESKYKEIWSQCTNNVLIANSVEELMLKINLSIFNSPYGKITYKE